MSTIAHDPPLFPMERANPLDPPAAYAQLRQEAPLVRVRLWDGSSAWLATRSQDVRAVLVDPRFSADGSVAGFPMISAARRSLLTAGSPQLAQLDPPDHTRLRKALAGEFTFKRIEALRPFVAGTVAQLLEAMVKQGPPLDFVENFALKLPSMVISKLLGVPYEEHEFFEECSRRRVALDVDPHVPVQAGKDMAAYCDRLLRQKERDPDASDDLLSRLARDQILPGHLTHEEGVSLANQLVMAGHETTANMIALGTLSLILCPEELAKLQADPALTASAVEEMLRYHTIVHFSIARIAKEDVEIGGQRIARGEGLFVLITAANRDPGSFTDPDRFDVARKTRNHFAFSFGIHQCLGQALARLEMQEVFAVLFRRLSDLRLAVPFDALSFKHRNMVYGVHQLPVVWGERGAG